MLSGSAFTDKAEKLMQKIFDEQMAEIAEKMPGPDPKKRLEKFKIQTEDESKKDEEEHQNPIIKEVSKYIDGFKANMSKLTEFQIRKLLTVFSEKIAVNDTAGFLPMIR